MKNSKKLKIYRDYLERLEEKGSIDLFFNDRPEYIDIQLTLLFENTEKNLIMFVDSLNFKDKYGEQCSTAFYRLLKYRKLESVKILLNNEPNHFDQKWIDQLPEYIVVKTAPENVDLKTKFIDNFRFQFETCNFIISDQKRLRQEYGENLNGLGSFNSKLISERLIDIFNIVFDEID